MPIHIGIGVNVCVTICSEIYPEGSDGYQQPIYDYGTEQYGEWKVHRSQRLSEELLHGFLPAFPQLRRRYRRSDTLFQPDHGNRCDLYQFSEELHP